MYYVVQHEAFIYAFYLVSLCNHCSVLKAAIIEQPVKFVKPVWPLWAWYKAALQYFYDCRKHCLSVAKYDIHKSVIDIYGTKFYLTIYIHGLLHTTLGKTFQELKPRSDQILMMNIICQSVTTCARQCLVILKPFMV